MPHLQVEPGFSMYYEEDYFGEPWLVPETALLIHGIAESSREWFAWVPPLARHVRVLRVDLRGCGRSTTPGPDYSWSIGGLAADLARFLDSLGIEKAHLVGAKAGGTLGLHFAARYPERTRTLVVTNGVLSTFETAGGKGGQEHHSRRISEAGVQEWAEGTQRRRLGSEVTQEQVSWWTRRMATADPRVCAALAASVRDSNTRSVLSRIQAPTLVLTPDRCPTLPLEMVRERQREIPNSELVVVSSDAYHLAAAKPDECAREAAAFLRRHAER